MVSLLLKIDFMFLVLKDKQKKQDYSDQKWDVLLQ